MHQKQTASENIVGKEEIAHNEQFLLFPQCFLLNQVTLFPFVHIFDITSEVATMMESVFSLTTAILRILNVLKT